MFYCTEHGVRKVQKRGGICFLGAGSAISNILIYLYGIIVKIVNSNKYPISGTFRTFNKIQSLRVIAKKILRDFWSKYPDCEQQLKSWYKEAEEAIWKNPAEIKRKYPSASILENNRIVFNIKGNNYRLIVRINYHYQMLWIRFIGTHVQYDKIDANKI